MSLHLTVSSKLHFRGLAPASRSGGLAFKDIAKLVFNIVASCSE
jgi:hypothetical protein